MSDRTKPILCVDFDGVVHSYVSPWQDAGHIPDDPVPGALRWLWNATKFFDVQIYSSRSKDSLGITAMRAWMRTQSAKEFDENDHPMAFARANYPINFVAEKPAAFLTIDDRAICFQGDWSALDPAELLKFKPWNKQPPSAAEPQVEEPIFEIADSGNLHDRIRIYASGKVEFYAEGQLDPDPPPVTITNRIPQLIARAIAASEVQPQHPITDPGFTL